MKETKQLAVCPPLSIPLIPHSSLWDIPIAQYWPGSWDNQHHHRFVRSRSKSRVIGSCDQEPDRRECIYLLYQHLSLHLSPSLWFLFISLSRNQIPLPLIDRKNALRFVFILYLTVKLISPKSFISHPFLHLNALFCWLPSPLRPTRFILKSNRNNKTMTQRVHDTYYNVQQAET